MNLRAIGNKVLVQPIYQPSQVGSIYIPQGHAEDRPQEATVVAIGPQAKVDVQVGDRVITNAHAGQWLQVDGKKHRLLEPQDVIALVEQAL